MQPLPAKSASVSLCDDPVTDLELLIKKISPDKVFVLTDEQTYRYCLPLIKDVPSITDDRTMTIRSGDDFKNIEALSSVWRFLSDKGASRHSLLINLGGGMPCDLGGFAAATYKRGIPFVNLPTTLLAMVDASVGGKTGINFNGFKNEIGVFRLAEMVLIHIQFLETLDRENLLSGYAEMLKHALIDKSETLEKLMIMGPSDITAKGLSGLVAESVLVKDRYVENDPRESGIRKALNLGHTIGHAFESLSMKKGKPVLHGYAVAWGIVAELQLAGEKLKFPSAVREKVERYITDMYGHHNFNESDFDDLYALMKHDKKNKGERINFTLLAGVGKPVIDVDCSRDEIFRAIGVRNSDTTTN
ncbi:3-dehydroquinate synthase [Anaerophaga thermohalophila]|uniref:3-dehydroquinate synthase n=1 Tax=Anaerophaga thermohalophila TaxID=177400 RepID=UPI000237CE66|nr:3-dehydroquinate synthase [Anaerophaga thermohalophila]